MAIVIIAWVALAGFLAIELVEVSPLLQVVLVFLATMFPIPILAFGLTAYFKQRAFRRARALTIEHPGDLQRVVDGLARTLRSRGLAAGTAVKQLASGLVAAGYRGITVRVAPSFGLATVDAVGAAVEPVPLDETDARFRELRGEPQETEVTHANGDTYWRIQLTRVPRMLAQLLAIGFVMLLLVSEVMASIQTGRPTLLAVILVISLLTSIRWVKRALFGIWATQKLWVVNSMLIRRAGLFRPLRAFDSRFSVMILQRAVNGEWTFGVADAHGAQSGLLSEQESLMLLRCWLSATPPPPISHLENQLGRVP